MSKSDIDVEMIIDFISSAIIGFGAVFAFGVAVWLYRDGRKHWDRTMR